MGDLWIIAYSLMIVASLALAKVIFLIDPLKNTKEYNMSMTTHQKCGQGWLPWMGLVVAMVCGRGWLPWMGLVVAMSGVVDV